MTKRMLLLLHNLSFNQHLKLANKETGEPSSEGCDAAHDVTGRDGTLRRTSENGKGFSKNGFPTTDKKKIQKGWRMHGIENRSAWQGVSES